MSKIDIIILAIVGIFTLIGYYRGILGTAFSLIQFAVVIYASILFAPTVSKFLISTFGVDKIILEWIYANPDKINGVISLMNESLLQDIIARIINVISLILLFICLKLICTIIFSILNKIAKLPILNEVNKIGGILTGLIEGIAIVYLLIVIINWLPISSLEFLKQELPNSKFGSAINSYVPVVTNEIINMVKVKI